MPLTHVNVRDDVWIKGETRCEPPLIIPNFALPTFYYSYLVEEEVRKTRTVRDSKGNTRTETYYSWETRERSEDSTDFDIVDGDCRIRVKTKEAQLDGLVGTGYAYPRPRWRISANYFPYPSTVHSIGSVSEKKEYLEPYENIPLVVTTKTRKDYLDGLESSEKTLGIIGNILLLLGIFLIAAGLIPYQDLNTRLIVNGIVGFLVFMIIWSIRVFNRLVHYRIRTRTAWAHIDVDVKNRFDLIPNLVSVIKEVSGYEKDVFDKISKLHSDYASGNLNRKVDVANETSIQTHKVLTLIDKYPDLKSNESYTYLHKQLVALEEKISFARSFFNETVTEYNNLAESIPSCLIARPFGFKPQHYLSFEQNPT